MVSISNLPLRAGKCTCTIVSEPISYRSATGMSEFVTFSRNGNVIILHAN